MSCEDFSRLSTDMSDSAACYCIPDRPQTGQSIVRCSMFNERLQSLLLTPLEGAMDRRTFILGTAAAAYHTSRLMARGMAAVELGSIDGSVGGNNFTPIQFLDYLISIKLTWAMLSLNAATLGDEAALRQIREHADRLGIKLQLAFGSVCPSARAFNAQLGTVEEQIARALKASQIFGATCMRCILGGDPERPQIDMHIDNMIKAVRAVRSRILDSGIKLA